MKIGKSHLLISGHKFEQVWSGIGEDRIRETSNVKLLGIVIKNQLNLDRHVTNLCFKIKNKLNVLTRRVK